VNPAGSTARSYFVAIYLHHHSVRACGVWGSRVFRVARTVFAVVLVFCLCRCHPFHRTFCAPNNPPPQVADRSHGPIIYHYIVQYNDEIMIFARRLYIRLLRKFRARPVSVVLLLYIVYYGRIFNTW